MIELDNEHSVMARVSAFIMMNTCGNYQPKEIWLNKEDYQQLYKELKQIQRMWRGHEVLEVPESKVMAGFRAVYYEGAEVIYSPFAEPLPQTIKAMKNWVNRPFIALPDEGK